MSLRDSLHSPSEFCSNSGEREMKLLSSGHYLKGMHPSFVGRRECCYFVEHSLVFVVNDGNTTNVRCRGTCEMLVTVRSLPGKYDITVHLLLVVPV